jgi:DHA2 family multidrug resistance protein
MALKQMTAMAHRQAVVMSFADVFLMLTVLFVMLAALGIIMKRPAPVAAGAGGQ